MKTLGLCLSGGSAKGFAHIGLLKTLEEYNITPTIVSGTSAGAIVGVLFAAGYKGDDIANFILESKLRKIFRLQYPEFGLMGLEYLSKRLLEYLPHDSFEALNYPVSVCVTNLNTGQPEHITSGSLTKAVIASASLPTFFKAVQIGDSMYTDGGVTCNMPARAIRDQCEVLVGMNLMSEFTMESVQLRSVKAIARRCFVLSIWSNTRPDLEVCDLVISDEKIANIGMFELKRAREIIDLGYEATIKRMPEILELLKD
ncbi:MAG: patatin-like phospholipase family protein [Saprospiraceae bacterium]